MDIKYHKLVGVDFVQSPNGGDQITPTVLTMHYTAGYNGAAAISRFKDKASEVSAHLVIDRDGKVTQMMPFNKKAWHAGPSRLGNLTNLNSHAIGFEFVNIGFLKQTANGLVDAYGNLVDKAKFEDYVIAPNPRVGAGNFYWPVYTKAQIDVGLEIAKACIDSYNISAICSHEEIDTRGWKTDPGPAFPMKAFKELLGSDRKDEVTGKAYTVNTPSLNVRSGPGTNWPVVDSLKAPQTVTYRERDGDWFLVRYLGSKEGWVSSKYLK
jgi:N-acetylmuramoyl-L-alanine amidase